MAFVCLSGSFVDVFFLSFLHVLTQVPKITLNTKSLKDRHSTEIDIPSWRLGLRKTGSTSAVPEETKKNTINEDDKNLSRSASSPRLTEENENKKNEKNVS